MFFATPNPLLSPTKGVIHIYFRDLLCPAAFRKYTVVVEEPAKLLLLWTKPLPATLCLCPSVIVAAFAISILIKDYRRQMECVYTIRAATRYRHLCLVSSAPPCILPAALESDSHTHCDIRNLCIILSFGIAKNPHIFYSADTISYLWMYICTHRACNSTRRWQTNVTNRAANQQPV